MATSDESLVGRGRSEQLAYRALARASARPVRRTLAAAVAASAFAVVSVVGLGAVADQAAPGDAMYVVDRAYESVGRVMGRPTDRSEETMVEALKLMESGNRQAAVDHLTKELNIQLGEPASAQPIVEDSSPSVPLAVAPTTTTAPAAAAVQVTDASSVDPIVEGDGTVEEDPLKLALEYALAAKRAANNTDDATVTAEADTAMRSVLQLAVAPSDTELAVAEEDSETVAASETSTTTTTVPEEPRRGRGNTTTTTTTTSVPEEDLSQTGSGDGQSSNGDDVGDSQEGAGGSTQPGDGGSDTLILPIP